MAEHDWRELLDDPHIVATVERVYKGPGWTRYAHSNPRAYDELEPWLWDKAVAIAQWYTDTTWHWPKTLYTVLARSIDHYHRDVTRDALTGSTSIDDALDRYREDGIVGILTNHHLVADDPLAILLRLENLEARTTDTTPRTHDGLCDEPLCRDAAVTTGLCERHYLAHRRSTADPCAIQDCDGYAIPGSSLCNHHYRLTIENDDNRPRCTEPGCTKTATRRGMCDTDYRRALRDGRLKVQQKRRR